MSSLKGRDLLSINDLTAQEIQSIIKLAMKQKRELRAGNLKSPLDGKTFALYFEKPSLRTRVSFQVGIAQLGGASMYLSSEDTHFKRGESLDDAGRVLSRYVDGIVFRAFNHSDVATLAAASTIPVVNALSDFSHPCQALADLLTIYEKKTKKKHIKVAYVGDGNNVAHSLIYTFSKAGVDLCLAVPKGYDPNPDVMACGIEEAARTGAALSIVRRPADAVAGADVVYTDTWVSMGMEKEAKERLRAFAGFMVDAKLMARAKPDAIFMHDLPAYRGKEVHEDVIDGPQSVVFDQAENRLHAQKAVLTLLTGD